MRAVLCPQCMVKMYKNGKTSSGTQRWRCPQCGGSSVIKYNKDEHDFKLFYEWILSKQTQEKMTASSARSFRRRIDKFWKIWPMPLLVDEVHRVIYIDGIYLERNLVFLIARSEEHVLSWFVAKQESSWAYAQLLSRIAPPLMVVSDGGSGFKKAVKKLWPQTKIQRCTYHVHKQIVRYVSQKPNLLAGQELLQLSYDLIKIKNQYQAEIWLEHYFDWCDMWGDFLEEVSVIDGRKQYTHERLRKARRSLSILVNEGTLFTFLNEELCKEGPLPSKNNRIEGGTNSQIRVILREHRGLSKIKRIKACGWYCLNNTEYKLTPKEILEIMPTDDDIELLKQVYGLAKKDESRPDQWGHGVVWDEFHTTTRYANLIPY